MSERLEDVVIVVTHSTPAPDGTHYRADDADDPRTVLGSEDLDRGFTVALGAIVVVLIVIAILTHAR